MRDTHYQVTDTEKGEIDTVDWRKLKRYSPEWNPVDEERGEEFNEKRWYYVSEQNTSSRHWTAFSMIYCLLRKEKSQ